MMTLETERLLLREFNDDDAAAFYELNSDPAVTRYTHDAPPEDIEQARQILRDHPMADYRKHGFGRWACVLKEEDRVIGFAGLKYLDELAQVDVGYRLLRAYWGRGLATEASRAALDDGFERLGLERILGLVVPENKASVRVLEKLGLRFAEIIDYRGHDVAKYVIERSATR